MTYSWDQYVVALDDGKRSFTVYKAGSKDSLENFLNLEWEEEFFLP